MNRARAIVSATAVALVLSACAASASPAPDPEALLRTATGNARSASSVHLSGTGGCAGTAFTTDMLLLEDGRAAGQVTLGGTVLNIVSTPERLYVNAPAQFWTVQAGPAASRAIGSKWVDMPRSGNPCLVAVSSMRDVVANYLGYTGAVKLLDGSTYQGQPARLVSVGTSTGIWLSNATKPYPLAVKAPDTSTDMAFTDWGADASIVVPPALDVISSVSLPRRAATK